MFIIISSDQLDIITIYLIFLLLISDNTNVNIALINTVKDKIITEMQLKSEETRKFVDNSFRDGVMKTTGTDIDKLMPPVSRFGGGNRAEKKQGIIDKMLKFFEKYFGLV